LILLTPGQHSGLPVNRVVTTVAVIVNYATRQSDTRVLNRVFSRRRGAPGSAKGRGQPCLSVFDCPSPCTIVRALLRASSASCPITWFSL